MTKHDFFLATTAIEEFWDTSRPMVFLGEWCRLYSRRDFIYGLDYRMAPQLWTNPDDIDQGIDVCSKYYEKFLPRLADFLNGFHGLQKDVSYYRIIGGDWLLHFVHVLYDRYVGLKTAYREFGPMETILLDSEQRYFPLDYLDFMQKVQQDSYNLLLYSDILRHLNQRHSSKKLDGFPQQPDVYSTGTGALRKKLVEAITRMMSFCARTRPVVITDPYYGGSFGKKAFLLSLRSKGAFVHCFFDKNVKIPYRITCDARAAPLEDSSDEFSALLSRLIPKHLPVAFLEAFPALRAHSLRQCPNRSKGFATCTGIYGNLPFKIAAAEYSNMAPLFCVQHGGFYGTDRRMVSEEHECKIAKTYFSWGWGNKWLPHPRLPAPTQRKSNEGNALLVMSDPARYVFRLHHAPTPGTMLKDHFFTRYQFIRHLPENVSFEVRLRNFESGWSQRERLLDMFPDIQFASLVPFQQAIDQARVCIVEYLGSTFLEAICANVPSVVFHSSNLYNVREEAKPFINKLIEVGIMYYDPVEAAKHVGKVYDDISSWWDSDDVQEARNSFVDRFAKTHQNWTHMWHNALTQELKN